MVKLNKMVVEDDFFITLEKLKQSKISLPETVSNISLDLHEFIFPPNGELVCNLNKLKTFKLNPTNNNSSINKFKIFSYDETVKKYVTLQGSAYLTTHCIVKLGEIDYEPITLSKFYFYTRIKSLVNIDANIKFSESPDADSKKDYVKDKVDFLLKHVESDSILFIDGPLIGGDWYIYMIQAIKKFHKKNIIPIFMVKNSSSDLITKNIPKLKKEYNSDMHWSYDFLNVSERTNFFTYRDVHNNQNAKVFCYFKPFDCSPQRIEFHIDTYNRFKDEIDDYVNFIQYLMLVNGDEKSPQIRTIAIAESFARKVQNLFNLNKIMRSTNFTSSMNQERFAW